MDSLNIDAGTGGGRQLFTYRRTTPDAPAEGVDLPPFPTLGEALLFACRDAAGDDPLSPLGIFVDGTIVADPVMIARVRAGLKRGERIYVDAEGEIWYVGLRERGQPTIAEGHEVDPAELAERSAPAPFVVFRQSGRSMGMEYPGGAESVADLSLEEIEGAYREAMSQSGWEGEES